MIKFENTGIENIHTAQQAFEACTGKIDTDDLSPEARIHFIRSVQTMFYSGMCFAFMSVVHNKQRVSNDVADTRMRSMLGEALDWLATEGAK